MKAKYLALMCVSVLSAVGCSGLETAYQRSTDQVRIRDIEHIAELAETFKRNTGYYPHERRMYGLYRRFQVARGGQGPRSTRNDHDDLVELFKAGIDVPFSIPYDPQKVAVPGTRRFYAYWSDGERYTVSAQLGTARPGAVEKGRWHFHYEIRSEPGRGEVAPR